MHALSPTLERLQVVVDEISKDILVGGITPYHKRDAGTVVKTVHDIHVMNCDVTSNKTLLHPSTNEYTSPWVTSQLSDTVQSLLRFSLRVGFNSQAGPTCSPSETFGLVSCGSDLYDARFGSKAEYQRFQAAIEDRSNQLSQAVRRGGRTQFDRDPRCVRRGCLQFIDDECWVVNDPGSILEVTWVTINHHPQYRSEQNEVLEDVSWMACVVFEKGVGLVSLQVDALLAGEPPEVYLSSYFVAATNVNVHTSPFVAARFVWFVELTGVNRCSVCPVDLHLALWSNEPEQPLVYVYTNDGRGQQQQQSDRSGPLELSTVARVIRLGDGASPASVDWRRLCNGTVLTVTRHCAASGTQLDVYSLSEPNAIDPYLGMLFETSLSRGEGAVAASKLEATPKPKYAFKSSQEENAIDPTAHPEVCHPLTAPPVFSPFILAKMAAIPLSEQRVMAESALKRQHSSQIFTDSPLSAARSSYAEDLSDFLVKVIPSRTTVRPTGGERLKVIEVNRWTGAAYSFGYPYADHCVFASGHHYLTKAASINVNAFSSFVQQFGPIKDFHIIQEGKCRSVSSLLKVKDLSKEPSPTAPPVEELVDGDFAIVPRPDEDNRKPFACEATNALAVQAASFFGVDGQRQGGLPYPPPHGASPLLSIPQASPILERVANMKRKHQRAVVESLTGAIAVVCFGVSGGHPSPGRIERLVSFGGATLAPARETAELSLVDIREGVDMTSHRGLGLVVGLYSGASEKEALTRVWFPSKGGQLIPLLQHRVLRDEGLSCEASVGSSLLKRLRSPPKQLKDTPSKATTTTRETLEAFMRDKCPDKAKMLDVLLKAVKGDHEKLLTQLVAKYGEWTPLEPAAAEVSDAQDEECAHTRLNFKSVTDPACAHPSFVTLHRVPSSTSDGPQLQLSVWGSDHRLYGRSIVSCELGRAVGLWEFSSGSTSGLCSFQAPTGNMSGSFCATKSLTDAGNTFLDIPAYPCIPGAYRCFSSGPALCDEVLCVGGAAEFVLRATQSTSDFDSVGTGYVLKALSASSTLSTVSDLSQMGDGGQDHEGLWGALYCSPNDFKVVLFSVDEKDIHLIDVFGDALPSMKQRTIVPTDLSVCETASIVTVSVWVGDTVAIYQRDLAGDFTQSRSCEKFPCVATFSGVHKVVWDGREHCIVLLNTGTATRINFGELHTSVGFETGLPGTSLTNVHSYQSLRNLQTRVLSFGDSLIKVLEGSDLTASSLLDGGASESAAVASSVKSAAPHPLISYFKDLLPCALRGDWGTLLRYLEVLCADSVEADTLPPSDSAEALFSDPTAALCGAIQQSSNSTKTALVQQDPSSRLQTTEAISNLKVPLSDVGDFARFSDLTAVALRIFSSSPEKEAAELPAPGAPMTTTLFDTLDALASKASARLMEREIVGLDGISQMGILIRVDAIREILKQEGKIDAGSKRLVACWKLRTTAIKFQKSGQVKHARPSPIPVSAFAWCLLSEAQDQLAELTNPSQSWSDCAEAGVPLWMKSLASLRRIAEEIGKNAFQRTRAIRDCGFWYCLAKKVGTLVNLCKAVNDVKLAQFFSRDFSEERSQEAASNNAYAALSKGLVEYGCGFFLLAGDGMSAAMSVVQRSQDWLLGFFIVRMAYEDDPSRIREYVAFLEGCEGIAITPWMRCIFQWRMGKPLDAVKEVWLANADDSLEALHFLQQCCSHVTIFTRRKDEVLPHRVHCGLAVSAMRAARRDWSGFLDSLGGASWGRSAAAILPVIRAHVGLLPVLSTFLQIYNDGSLPELLDIERKIQEVAVSASGSAASKTFQADFSTGQVQMFGSDSEDDTLPAVAVEAPKEVEESHARATMEELLAQRHHLKQAAAAIPHLLSEARCFLQTAMEGSVQMASDTASRNPSPQRALQHLSELWLLSETLLQPRDSRIQSDEFETDLAQLKEHLGGAIASLAVQEGSATSPASADPIEGRYNRAGVANLAIGVVLHTLGVFAAYYRLPALAGATCLAKGITSYPTEGEAPSDGIGSAHCVLRQYVTALVRGITIHASNVRVSASFVDGEQVVPDSGCAAPDYYRFVLVRNSQAVRSLLTESFSSVWSSMPTGSNSFAGSHIQTLQGARLLRAALLQSSTLISHQQTEVLMVGLTFIPHAGWRDGLVPNERERIGGGIRSANTEDGEGSSNTRFAFVDENSLFTELQRGMKCLVHVLSCCLTGTGFESMDQVSVSLEAVGRDLCIHALEGSVVQPVLPLWSDASMIPLTQQALRESHLLRDVLFPGSLSSSVPSLSLVHELAWMWSLAHHFPSTAASSLLRVAKVIGKIQADAMRRPTEGGLSHRGLIQQLSLDFRTRGAAVRLLRLLEARNSAAKSPPVAATMLPSVGCGFSVLATFEHSCTCLCIDNSSRDSCYVGTPYNVDGVYGLRDQFVCPENLEFVSREQAKRDHATVAFSTELSTLLASQQAGVYNNSLAATASSLTASTVLEGSSPLGKPHSEVLSPTGHKSIVNPEEGRTYSSGLSTLCSPVGSPTQKGAPRAELPADAASRVSSIVTAHQSHRSLASLPNTVMMESHPHLPVFVVADGSGHGGVFQFGNDERLSYFFDPSCGPLACLRFSAQGYFLALVGSSSGCVSIWRFGPAPVMVRCLPHFFTKEGGAACYLNGSATVVAVCGTDAPTGKSTTLAFSFNGASSSSAGVVGRLSLLDTSAPAPIAFSVALPFPYPKHIFNDAAHPEALLVMDNQGTFCIFDIQLRALRPLGGLATGPITHQVDVQRFASLTPSFALKMLHSPKTSGRTNATITASALHTQDGLIALGTSTGEVALFDAGELLSIGKNSLVDVAAAAMPSSVQTAFPNGLGRTSAGNSREIVDIKFTPSSMVFATREGRVCNSPIVSPFVKSLFCA